MKRILILLSLLFLPHAYAAAGSGQRRGGERSLAGVQDGFGFARRLA